jgi:hypothetical protein
MGFVWMVNNGCLLNNDMWEEVTFYDGSKAQGLRFKYLLN